MLRESEQSLSDMDLLAVAAGPGSFTGLRIGVSALKGLAWAADKPCCGVSTLEAMAQNLRHMDGLIVCAMDARRSQVYNAVFAAEGGQLTRLTPDRAIALSLLAEELQGDPRPKLVVGDGAALCSGFLTEAGIDIVDGDVVAPAAQLIADALQRLDAVLDVVNGRMVVQTGELLVQDLHLGHGHLQGAAVQVIHPYHALSQLPLLRRSAGGNGDILETDAAALFDHHGTEASL